MIQRKQTIFLFVAFILTVACLCLPIGSFMPGDTLGDKSVIYNLWITSSNGNCDLSVWPLFAILLITCPIALIAIFSYRNRITQSRFCMFNILLVLGWYVVYAMIILNLQESGNEIRISFPVILPVISMILYFMARKAILADEALVRSADRIR